MNQVWYVWGMEGIALIYRHLQNGEYKMDTNNTHTHNLLMANLLAESNINKSFNMGVALATIGILNADKPTLTFTEADIKDIGKGYCQHGINALLDGKPLDEVIVCGFARSGKVPTEYTLEIDTMRDDESDIVMTREDITLEEVKAQVADYVMRHK